MRAAARAGVVWSSLAFVATRALTLVSIAILARLLAPSQFGVVAAVLVVVGLLEVGSDLGMKATVIYEQGADAVRVNTAFWLSVAISAALSGLGVLLAPLAADFFNVTEATDLFRLAVLNVALTGLGNVHEALLLRDLAFRSRGLTEMIRGSVRAGVSIALALAGLGAASLVWGMLAGTLAWVASLWWITRFLPSPRFEFSIARSMSAYGTGASLLNALAAVTTQLDAAIIGRVLGERALGLYSVAFRVPQLAIQSVVWNVSLVVFPALARQRVLDRDELAPATLALVRYHALYALPLAAALTALAPPLVNVLFSSAWADAAGVLAAVSVMMAIGAIVNPLGDLLKAVGRQWVLVSLNIAMIPAMVAAIIAASSVGIVAVAWARAGSLALFALAVVAATSRGLQVRARSVALAVLPGAITAIGVLGGASAVRSAWPALSIGPFLVGAA
ncbi:MAG: oligosaccharide flippase family protein, partial [Chloroflexota bacterium]|nr:oligosaccharide flippase family protein [Chloroflexota bacterium]